MNKIKKIILASVFCTGSAIGFASCDTGTTPGETNVERSDIKEEGSIVTSGEDNPAQAQRDSMEQHYDHADHENHDKTGGGAVHAGDGQKQKPKEGTNRDQVKQ